MKKNLLKKSNKGFSLVELIVVIAIMAILVGVAVPVYTGYISKANLAKDEQLLSEINSAFMVAAVAEGVTDFTFANEADNNKPAIAVAEGTIDIENMKPDYLADAMVEILGTDLKFSVIEGIWYNPNLRCFVESTMTFTFNGKEITVNAEDVAILSGNNAFSNRGSEALLEDVGVLENLLETGIGDDVLDAVVETEEFVYALGGYLGLKLEENESFEEYFGRVDSALEESEDPDGVLYSAQIMFAASQAANTTEAQLNALFVGDGAVTSKIEVKNNGVTDYNATMANAALAYGMYTAYVQQFPNAENADNFTLTINSDEFAAYYTSEQGQADLEAYMAAMNMISDNTDNPEVTSSILENGISGNQDLADLMKDIMGN